MGGDDLGSDDEYLTAPLKSNVVTGDDNDDVSSNDDQGDDFSAVEGGTSTFRDDDESSAVPANGNKRKRDVDNTSKHTKQQQQQLQHTPSSSTALSSQFKRSKKGRNGGPLQSLGTKILDETIQSKAEIVSVYAGVKFLPQHMARPLNDKNTHSNNFMDRLLCWISKKQLKKIIARKSPKMIIVCLSARRCVAVLKDLVPLRLRVAKLFPKQGTIDDQARQLETTDFGLAVGTPHRIKELLEKESLSLNGTALFGLDVYENDKRFSVYTLADTAVPTQELLRDHVYPQCCNNNGGGDNKSGKKGQELKVAFV
ncbi:U3-containing 90S pre-ribosomal complex subunit [Nitzschia inconspicua]|uniref:U3-containing 90S pre-ribosomal complex subunit n=1 Tax=Nitzschia inconspicua TaxID=303405 RepID=A0A9K3L7X8_9STRA|nr:U3-containing 90S pre-ribosomal complex subunit [Nitzschia inconspicua]